MRARPGTVYLVGAGPGDPGLLTVAAAGLLATADVVLHDALVSDLVLANVRDGASVCAVGKRASAGGADQAAIEQRLIAEARAGRAVIRLKGGDPFVFGRGGEEALACARAGVPFVVVPGISSAIAGPAYAGIPVTQRGLARSFAVVTGTTESGADIDWSGFAAVDTLVVLMAGRKLGTVAGAIAAGGRSPETPAAVVESATLPAQRVIGGTLGTIAALCERQQTGTPAILVVGDVAALSSQLAWFTAGPLNGASVVITTTHGRAQRQLRALRDAGATAIVIPAIAIDFPESSPIPHLLAQSWDWVVLPSQNAVESLMRALAAIGRDARALAAARIAVAGPGTARELRRQRLIADFEPDVPGAAAIASALPIRSGDRVLLLQSNVAPPDLEQALTARGATVTRAEAYRTLPRPLTPVELESLASAAAVTFASPSAVRSIQQALAALSASIDSAKLVAIGPTTANAMLKAFGRCDALAATPDAEALVAAIVEALA